MLPRGQKRLKQQKELGSDSVIAKNEQAILGRGADQTFPAGESLDVLLEEGQNHPNKKIRADRRRRTHQA